MTDTLEIDRVIIRPLRESELPALEWDGEYARYRSVYRQTYRDVLRGQRMMLVAVAGEEMVGQVFVQLTSAEARYADGSARAYLYALRVRAPWRGKGLGARLVRVAETLLRRRGFTTAVIAAAKENVGARRLYERLGYRVFDDDPGVWYFTDVNGQSQQVAEPCWVLEKNLGREPEELN